MSDEAGVLLEASAGESNRLKRDEMPSVGEWLFVHSLAFVATGRSNPALAGETGISFGGNWLARVFVSKQTDTASRPARPHTSLTP